MLIYLLVVLLILIFQDQVHEIKSQLRREKVENRYLLIVCCILVLLAALRGSTVGTDSLGYIQDYDVTSSYSLKEILIRKADFPGYYILSKICSQLHLSIHMFFGIVEGIYVYSIYKFTSRFSEDKLYTILCFEMIGLYSFSLAGLKQTLSMAFVLLYYLALIDKKYILTVMNAFVAYQCHHVSSIFLFGVALYLIRNWKIYYLSLAGIVLFALFGTSFIWSNMLTTLDSEHYTRAYMADEGYSNTTMIFYGVLLLILFLFSENYRKRRKGESKVVLGMSTLAFVFQAFSFISSAAFRLSFFFLPFMIIGFPNAFNKIRDKDTGKVVKFMVAFMIVFFFVYSNRNGGSVVPYIFFWQE